MSDTIQRTVCSECGALVYATFQTTWTAMQQAHRELRRHMAEKHYASRRVRDRQETPT